jgi:hypothetical protein
METYARDGGAAESRGIDAAIEDGIATAALSLAALIESPRHVEAFVVGVPT